MPDIDAQTFNTLVDLVIVYAGDATEQRALVDAALADAPSLRSMIQIAGNPRVFTVLLMRRCIDFGEIKPGKPAASAVLDYIDMLEMDEKKKVLIREMQHKLGDTTLEASPPAAHTVQAELPDATRPTANKHIFISYNSSDRGGFVQPFVGRLQDEGYMLWVDNLGEDYGGIRMGENWKQALANALNEAAAVILIITNESIASEWVQAEIRRTLALGKLLLPIQLRPINDETRKTLAGLGLRDVQYRDFSKDYNSAMKQVLDDLAYHQVPRKMEP